MRVVRQFILLLWKNFLLQRKQITVTLVQMITPLFFASLLIVLRIVPRGTGVATPTTWNSFSIPLVTSPGQGCTLYYSPNTSSVARTIMEGVVGRIEGINDTVGFDSEISLVRDFLGKLEEKQRHFNQSVAQGFINSNSCDILAAVVFLELPSPNLNDSESADSYSIKYKLRFPSTLRTLAPDIKTESRRWNTELVFPHKGTAGPRNDSDHGGPPDYVAESFLTLQYVVDMAIIEAIKNDSSQPDDFIDLEMERFPFPPYRTDTFISIIQGLFPLLLMVGLLFWSMLIVRDIVNEKEQRLKVSMQMMGLDRRLHWLAWLFRYLLLLGASVSIETWLLVADIGPGGPVLRSISPLLLFAFLMSYIVATIAFCLAVSALFSRANLATAVTGLLFIISYVPYEFLQPHYDSLVWPLKAVVCLLFNTAMAFGIQVIGEHESSGNRLDWATIGVASPAKSFTFLYVLLLLWFDILLYGVFAWYTDAVFPGEYGIPMPWNFPFRYLSQKLTSRSTAVNQMEQMKLRKDDGLSDEDSEADEFVPLMAMCSSEEGLDKDNFEPDPIGVTPGIMMHNLSKEFCVGSSRRKAVVDLTLNVFEGQVTILLGHNGAGKTTTFSILTGLYRPSSGKAFVNGFDIAKDMECVRQSLGVCPQDNVLFDRLTVEEHLVFFSKLKAPSVVQTRDEVVQMMSDVGLLSKRSAPVSTLSGGMKRKLSVGIAFIGGSKVVILDEPTTGMDPCARRQTWDLIRKCLPGRTVLLSTHSMDEAEALGNRIAIMVNGVIKCCGSPLFLKNRFGSGYRLTIEMSPDCNVGRLTEFIESYIASAELKSCRGSEVSYLLPHNSRGKFPQLFDGIDCERERLRIAVYGIAMATLEEVFLRVGSSLWSYETGGNSLLVNQESTGDDDDGESPYTSDQLVSKQSKPLVSGSLSRKSRRFRECLRHFCAMFRKKVLHTVRNRPVIIAQFLVPLVFVVVPLMFHQRLFLAQDSPPLAMDLSSFSDPVVVFGFGIASSPSSDLENFASNYSSVFDAHVTLVNVNNSRIGAKQCGTMRKYLADEGNKSFVNYLRRFEIAVCLSSVKWENLSIIEAIAFFNDEAYHTSAISLNAFDNAVLRYTMGSNRWRIQTINHPLPRTSDEILKDQAMQDSGGIMSSTVLGMSFLTTGFALFLIRERCVGAKRCQLTSGASALSFWSSTFLCDWVVFELLCVEVVGSFAAFHIQPFASDGNWINVALLLSLYGWAVLPFVYLASFCFSVPSSAFIWLAVGSLFLVSLTSIVDFVIAVGVDSVYVAAMWHLFTQLLPNYCLIQGLSVLYNNYSLRVFCQRDDIVFRCSMQAKHPCCKETCEGHCFVYSEHPLGMDSKSGIGQLLLILAFDGILYFTILLLIDSGCFRRCFYRIQDALNFLIRIFTNSQSEFEKDDLPEDDDDVAAERRRINETPHDLLTVTEMVLLKELTKKYGNLVAVDRLSVGIGEGECFGLLGVNGAGKTTVFEMIVGDKFISKGLAFLYGNDIRSKVGKVGYSPQTDALINELTGRELLSLYACLRGVDSKSIRLAVQDLMDALLLREDSDRLIKTYSGGTRRKLSTAVALVGWPQVILLDEPSSGLDPVARRHLWNTLLKLRDSKRTTVVLSTHSMEECETLCTRLAIMVNGRFQCMGSCHHLKSTFGHGFSLTVKLRADTEANSGDKSAEEVKTFLRTSLPRSMFKNAENNVLLCRISDETVRMSEVFQAMETLQSREPAVEDYSVAQTTLEEVFVSFAMAQLPSRPPISWAKYLRRAICRLVYCCCCLCCSCAKKCVTRHTSHK